MDPIPRRNLGASEEIVTRLRAADPDDAALRQLRLNLYIEAGEWHGLGDLFKVLIQVKGLEPDAVRDKISALTFQLE